MKKILAVLISATVLFAFAACDNSTTNNPYFGQQVQRVVLASTPDYVEGDTINPADVKVTVEYDNGSVTLTGEDVGMYNANGFTVTEAGSVAFDVKFGSYNSHLDEAAGAKLWKIYIPVYSIDSLKVDATNGQTTVEKGLGNVDPMELAYTLVYTKGTEKVERETSYVDLLKMGIAVMTTVDTSSAKVGDNVNVTIAATKTYLEKDNTVTVKLTPSDWQVEVVENLANVIRSVEIKQNTEVDVFNTSVIPEAAESSSSLLSNKVADLPWKVTVTFENDDVVTYTGKGTGASTAGSDSRITSVNVDFVDYVNESSTTIASTKKSSFNAKVTVDPVATDAKNVIVNSDVSFVYTTDYPTAITAVTAETKTYAAGNPIQKSDFTFYATKMASGIVYTVDDKISASSAAGSIELVTTSVDWGTADNSALPVSFKWTGDETKEPTITGTIKVENPKA